jgi:flagellar basal body L-ring protein FlgH
MAKVAKSKTLPKNKQLAAMYGDKKKITRGDIITAAKKNKGRA